MGWVSTAFILLLGTLIFDRSRGFPIRVISGIPTDRPRRYLEPSGTVVLKLFFRVPLMTKNRTIRNFNTFISNNKAVKYYNIIIFNDNVVQKLSTRVRDACRRLRFIDAFPVIRDNNNNDY